VLDTKINHAIIRALKLLLGIKSLKRSNQIKLGILGTLVSLFALYFVITQINLELFIEALQTAEYGYLLPCILLLVAGLVTRAFRWRVLLDNALPLARAFSIMNVAYLVNGVLPLRIGEVARVYLASQVRKPVPIMKTTSTIIVERLLDLLAVVVMVLLALALGSVPDEIRYASGFAAVIAMLGFIILIIVARQRHFVERMIERFLPASRIGEWVEHFLDGLQPITRPRQLLLAFWWTGVSWFFSIMAGYVLMFAFFEDGSIAATMLYIAAAAFAIALPAVPGNIGTYEASILLALTAMGYEQSSTAIAFAVMVHAVNVFVHASTGVIGFIQEGISLNQLSKGIQQMQQSELSNAL